MPSSRSEYQPLAQSIEEEEDLAESLHTTSTRTLRRPSRPVKIDLTKLDTAFKRWTESIAQKVKRKKKVEDNSKKEITQSIFGPPVESQGTLLGPVKTLDHKAPMSQADFDALVQSVKRAISEGIHPKMITKGSSGSYFARAKVEGRVQTVAVFKPKDEEPYGRLNPKTTKWLHRQFRWIIPFGRACLIPNLSYISEAAASLLDRRLELHIVPRTELVSLSSSSFFYDWIDRTAAKKGKPLPEKIGSMQYFLHGYTDASEFLRKHPWPGRAIADTFNDDTHRTGNFTKRCLNTLKIVCGRTGDDDDQYDDVDGDELFDPSEANEPGRPFYWSQALQQSFREELDKLVILDYLMLNTDRGADNYMIKYCEAPLERSLVDIAPTRTTRLEMPQMSELRRADTSAAPSPVMTPSPSMPSLGKSDSMPDLHKPYTKQPHIHIAAIDNSLSFPWEHPHGWRSYTYGWLYLPVSIIGRPFGEKTRNHFLSLLTNKEWWEETTYQLRKLFAVDPDFHPKMFNRQLAVIKGQAWNIVQSLKHNVTGPLELTRRQKVLVWDDEVEIVDEASEDPFDFTGPLSARSITSLPPLPKHRRAQSQSEVESVPIMRRTSTDALPRPVPFSARHQRVHPGTTGVTVLEHMERLDAVEAGFKGLGSEDLGIPDDEEEMDVAESASSASKATSLSRQEQPQPAETSKASASGPPSSSFSPTARSENLPSVPEVGDGNEDDLVALSMSTPQLDDGPQRNIRWTTHAAGRRSFDWMRSERDQPDSSKKRTVIAERLETVDSKPFFSFW
ncbi:hypothetical protein NEOLEDRAFT_1090374 [Neolentinus lepideus HHB14362 ss-1]|uniref:Phosphatidylinositol 4-kinase n=1 Tax=Neolentinus lepideus HHB14362 ss-1 TaxID=1314782 RepID=A0A165TL84_9AGAM|nr:hypothetical protein NEOLEDRAFT_1090374 [Neolentinus lepideus HHB14362 ss-1]